ncbi:hypothetical protein U7230_13895 [Carboxydochorda subterranea]|uniref:RFX-type winged-helix domain-containing protein n=1 Tax=Carboxydichorda subterranea TaxID=3109565 RepID=A0ABZ1BX14_9FIRM|nr:hypothetical protein [Limnochorda sp. L945t]WRP17160.1 hypothetical protein U7230_13895 [Limnochorda sp. L945t]
MNSLYNARHKRFTLWRELQEQIQEIDPKKRGALIPLFQALGDLMVTHPDLPISEKAIRAALRDYPKAQYAFSELFGLQKEPRTLTPEVALTEFLKQHTDRGGVNFQVDAKELYGLYLRWCQKHQAPSFAYAQWARTLHQLIPTLQHKRPWARGTRPLVYVGLRIRPLRRKL